MDVAIKTVGIKVLKDQLSAYIQDVKRGFLVLITDRDRVVAELREPMSSVVALEKPSRFMEYAEQGKIRLPTRPKPKTYPFSPIKLGAPDGTARRLLDEERGE